MAVIRGVYCPGGEFPLHLNYFTHLFYAPVAIHPETCKITPSANDEKLMKDFTSKAQTAEVKCKCILSIGEDTDECRVAFSDMVRTPDSRKIFIDISIFVAWLFGFDGLDLFWKYPDTETEFQMPNLFLLFKEWRESIMKESSESGKPPLLLTTIAYFAPKFFPPSDDKAYPFKAIKENVDFVNLVCYDYYGSRDSYVTAEHALLYDLKCRKSTHYGISSWINDTGIPEGKLVMGLPLYGRTWKLKYPTKNWIGAPATGEVGLNEGVMSYDDILNFKKVRHAHEVDDDKTVSAYTYDGTDWIGHDNPKSIKGKVQYAKDHKLGGYFFWALGMDKDNILPKAAFEAWPKGI